MSNLNTARSLVQADLDHARQVLDLWTHQVSELERALEQLDAVGTSRDALRVEYRGANTQALALEEPAAPKEGKKRGRKLAERSTAGAGQVTDAKAVKQRKAKARKAKATPEAKFKDPNSEKTWSGRGRRPFWMKADSQQYEIGSANQSTASEAQANEAKEAATATE